MRVEVGAKLADIRNEPLIWSPVAAEREDQWGRYANIRFEPMPDRTLLSDIDWQAQAESHAVLGNLQAQGIVVPPKPQL